MGSNHQSIMNHMKMIFSYVLVVDHPQLALPTDPDPGSDHPPALLATPPVVTRSVATKNLDLGVSIDLFP